MFSSKRFKFVRLLFLTSVILSSCSFWQTAESEKTNSNSFIAEKVESQIPFENREPEVFQAEIVITNYLDGEKTERIIKAARNGEKIRYDYSDKISFLQIDRNQVFLIESEEKIYAQNQTGAAVLDKSSETLKNFLTTEWLNAKMDAKFENLGADNGLAKYRVKGENEASETLIYVDEKLKFPLKQEFYSISGEQKTLLSAIEIRNLKLETDDKRFEVPKNFRKVPIEELQKIVREKRL